MQCEFPAAALKVLHNYGTLGFPAPQRSYTRLISKHLYIRSTVPHPQPWDLFSHMQYVADPNLDVFPYTTMIRACASRVLIPQPECALDLFTEMTVDCNILPLANDRRIQRRYHHMCVLGQQLALHRRGVPPIEIDNRRVQKARIRLTGARSAHCWRARSALGTLSGGFC